MNYSTSICRRFFAPVVVALVVFAATSVSAGQTAILTPDGTDMSSRFADGLERELEESISILDRDLTAAVFQVQGFKSPYNLSINEARIVGSGTGCSYLILLKSDTLRRTSFERKKYFESYAAVFLVDARRGDLIDFRLQESEAETAENAAAMILKTVKETAVHLGTRIREHKKNGGNAVPVNREGANADNESVRAPLPYKRIKPEYTKSADLYGIEATVDIEVEIDKAGKVTDTRIVRWAGFGLDESVERTVRRMNWRPADTRSGTFTMRVMLRYNFRDIEDTDS